MNPMQQRYFLVTAKCGHVGRNRYMPITFPVVSTSKKTAAALTKSYGRVKRDHKDAILYVEETDFLRYESQKITNLNDPYLRVKSKHEQDEIMPLIVQRLEPEMRESNKKRFEVSRKNIYHRKERIRNPKKWLRCNKDCV